MSELKNTRYKHNKANKLNTALHCEAKELTIETLKKRVKLVKHHLCLGAHTWCDVVTQEVVETAHKQGKVLKVLWGKDSFQDG